MTNVQIFIYIVVPLLILLFTFISAWLVYVMKTAKAEATELRKDLHAMSEAIVNARVLIASTYATREELHERLDRLEQRLYPKSPS